MADFYLGQIMQVGFGFAPVDWVQAAGQTLGISQNAALFSLLGTTFGGNGTSTFQLPNVMGRVIVGVGQLDECDLTLSDLTTIAKSFEATLDALYRGRPDSERPLASLTLAKVPPASNEAAAT